MNEEEEGGKREKKEKKDMIMLFVLCVTQARTHFIFLTSSLEYNCFTMVC